MTLMNLLNTLRGLTRVVLREDERMLVLSKGRFKAILGAGEHFLNSKDLLVERHVLDDPLFASRHAEALLRARPDLAEAHFDVVEAGADEVVTVLRKGVLIHVLDPGITAMLWKDLGPWTAEAVPLEGVPRVDPALLVKAMKSGLVDHFNVPDGHVGILTVRGTREGLLEPGTHGFWRAGGEVAVKTIDTRWRGFEVTGHEVLTRDRVSVRVNIAAEMRVVDPERATTEVRDFEETLRLALALAFRKTLGGTTLDGLLADRMAVGADAAEAVRREMAEIGIELREIALKDVILPGDMRDILNRVVEAEKEAEANVIRRREETNATRSLLNTAKVMADNPVMLRLKELEALGEVAGKVERLTVHNGTEGLMSDLVKLRD